MRNILDKLLNANIVGFFLAVVGIAALLNAPAHTQLVLPGGSSSSSSGTGFALQYTANNYYSPYTTSGGTGTTTAGNTYFVPVYYGTAVTLNGIMLRIGTASLGSVAFQVGIYANSGGLPTGNPLASGGTTNTSTNADVTFTFSSNYSITSANVGWYWLAAQYPDTTVTFGAISSCNVQGGSAVAGNGQFVLGTTLANIEAIRACASYGYQVTGTAGALPTATSPTIDQGPKTQWMAYKVASSP